MPVTFENVFDVSATWENGRLVRLRRAGYVEGLTSTDPADYVEEILDSGALPSGTVTISGSTLYLLNYEINLNDDSGIGDARIDVIYDRGEGSSENQPGQTPTLRGGSSLKQVETAVDRDGLPITVSYTWPEDSKTVYPNGEDKAGTTETTGGRISVLRPMSSVTGTIRVSTSSPGALAQAYSGHVNSTNWQGGVPRTWMCTEVGFRLIDDTQSPPIYELSFSFEYDENTWDDETTVRFIDPSTGEPPDDIEEGNGLKQIQYYPEKDFNEDF